MVSQIPASSERDARFTALLNPIRDLSKNWDVNIAAQLEDYLSELADISISFDGGRTTMNFAEAALLVQGSACVYSKKVDFLYNLVVQLLELLRNKKKLQKARENQGANDPNDSLDEDEFLPKDDIGANDKNIVMKPGESFNVGRNVRPSAPPLLIPLDGDERGTFHLYNAKGDVLGNKKDYKVNAWSVHNGVGALLEDSAVLQSGWNLSLHSTTIIETPGLMRDCGDEPLSDDDFPGDGGMNDDDLDVETPMLFTTSTPLKVPKISESPSKYSLRKRDKDLVSATEKALKLWQKLDPHEELPGNKAMRKGKTYKVIKSSPTKINGKKIEPINVFIRNQYYTPHFKMPKELENYPLFDSLKPQACKEFYRRKALMKEDKIEDEEQVDERLKYEDIFHDDHDDDDGGIDPGFVDDDNDEEFPPILEPTRITAGDKPEYEDITGVSESYVNLIKQYANQFMQEAKEAKLLTESSQTIAIWEEKLSKVLHEEEHHVPYDMHVYCTKIIEKFSPQPSKQTMDFLKIINGEASSEVCRYFLAMLQLANNYNIGISSNSDAGGIQNTKNVELTLLHRRQHFEDLEIFHKS